MFIPEYTITSGILDSISKVEYSRAIIENTLIFPNWDKQLQKEARVALIRELMRSLGKRVEQRLIKTYVDDIEGSSRGDTEVKRLSNAIELSEIIGNNTDLGEDDLKEIYKTMSGSPAQYRQTKLPKRVDPEEILAKSVEFMDWYNSLDSRETHTVIRAGILRAHIELLAPFESRNLWLAAIASQMCLAASGYDIKGYLTLEGYFENNKREYSNAISSIKEDDYTEWLEFYTRAFSSIATTLKEKVVLLSKDTKVAKASGKAKLTPRQSRLVEYLQDYGILQNRDFNRIFPDISEDSVLRDLKTLIDKGIVVKQGKTKSSRYELR